MYYRLFPDLAVEYFGDKALVLVPLRDKLLTVNKAAADLLELAQKTFGGGGFSEKKLVSLLLRHYHLPQGEAGERAANVIASWLKHDLLTGGD